MSKFLTATVAALTLILGVNSLANATEYKTEYCHETKAYWKFEKVVTYKTITEFKHERREFTKWVTEYDHHNRPHRFEKVFHKNVKVPFHKQITVVTWVKVVKVHDHHNRHSH